MFKDDYCRQMDKLHLDKDRQRMMIEAMCVSTPKWTRRTVRAMTVAAVVCVLLMVTAAAYCMGAFAFLTGQSEYAMLGLNEVYETCASPVGKSVTADNGDIFTVERVAMDETFCTVFYSLHFQQAVAAEEELVDSHRMARRYTPYLTLYADGEEISAEGYGNSFERQEYLSDGQTLYGAWRFLLRRPLKAGETVQLQIARYGEYQGNWAGKLIWESVLEFDADPIQGEHFDLDAIVFARIGGKTVQVQVRSLDRSPLGTLLKLRWPETDTSASDWYDFVLRDGETGAYIPYDEVVVNHYWDPEGYVESVYELYGDVSELKELEVIPNTPVGGISPRQVVDLKDLPSTDSGNPDGGYAPASYEAVDGQLIVEMQPVGAVNAWYARLGNGVYFRDAQGEELFEDVWVKKIKNRSDGTITVISTPSAESYVRDVDKVAQIWFFVQQYELEMEKAVKISLR